MIPSLFLFEFKHLLRRLMAFAGLALALGAAAVWLYLPEPQGELRLIAQELPQFTRLMGYSGSANLPVHVMGVLYSLVLPAVFVISALTLSLRLIARPIADGRMAQRLAAPHRRGAVILTFFWLMALEGLVIAMVAFLGQVAGAFIFLGGQADFPALMRLALGMWLSALPVYGLMVLIACATAFTSGTRRLGAFLGIGVLGLMMASRLPGWARFLRYATPFSLLKGQELLTGFERLWLSGLGLPVALILAALGAVAFSRRDL